MNFNEADYVMTNTPAMLRAMAGMVQAFGVRPEIVCNPARAVRRMAS